MKIAFIIIYFVVSPVGGQMIVNPTQEVMVVSEDEDLAKCIQKVLRRGYGVNYKVYRAEEVNLKYWTTTQKEEVDRIIPHIEIVEE